MIGLISALLLLDLGHILLFPGEDAVSVGIIGGADGPTAIYVTSMLPGFAAAACGLLAALGAIAAVVLYQKRKR